MSYEDKGADESNDATSDTEDELNELGWHSDHSSASSDESSSSSDSESNDSSGGSLDNGNEDEGSVDEGEVNDGYVYHGVEDDEFCEGQDMYSCQDAQAHRNKRRRLIVLMLSALLSCLLTNFGYQLFQLFKVSDISGPPSLEDDVSTVNDNHNPGLNYPSKSHNDREMKGSETNDIQPMYDDDIDDYQMPHHPTRIYTHASLSSKNYRAGGVLSDEMLRRFEEDGVVVIRNLVSPKLLDRLDLASQILIDGKDGGAGHKKKKRRGQQFHMVKNGAVFLGVPPPKGEPVCSTANSTSEDGVCTTDDGSGETDDNIVLSSFRDLAMYSKIPRVAASLLRLDELRAGGEEYLKPGSKRRRREHKERELQQQEENPDEGSHAADDSINLRICRDIFLTKDDDTYACGWHVDDTGFWPSLASDPGVNAWIALDDMPAPRSGSNSSVATFALSLGSHRASWRHRAYQVTGSTHTVPPEGFQSAADLIRRRTGSGTCNIQTSAPDLYEELEKNKVIYDLKKGDVIFHHRWVFHRTVTANEYGEMARGDFSEEGGVDQGKNPPSAQQQSKIFRRYSIRYSPGTAVVPPGYGVELSVLNDSHNANRSLNEIVERSGLPWYPKVWPHVHKRKPLRSSSEETFITEDDFYEEEEEIEGITELVYEAMPKAEILQKERKKEIQRLLSTRGQQ